jgi:hypothetical protein
VVADTRGVGHVRQERTGCSDALDEARADGTGAAGVVGLAVDVECGIGRVAAADTGTPISAAIPTRITSAGIRAMVRTRAVPVIGVMSPAD